MTSEEELNYIKEVIESMALQCEFEHKQVFQNSDLEEEEKEYLLGYFLGSADILKELESIIQTKTYRNFLRSDIHEQEES